MLDIRTYVHTEKLNVMVALTNKPSNPCSFDAECSLAVIKRKFANSSAEHD